jgi:hypothetical protein
MSKIEICFYCNLNPAQNKKIIHPPIHKQVHPTCSVCEYRHILFENDKKKYALIRIFGKVLMLVSLISLIPYGWKISLPIFIIGIVVWFLFAELVSKREINRRQLEFEFAKKNELKTIIKQYPVAVDPKSFKWCKNCSHLRNKKDWEGFSSVRRDDTFPDDNMIPCMILSDTRSVWVDYFELPKGKRTLYPNDCQSYIPK